MSDQDKNPENKNPPKEERKPVVLPPAQENKPFSKSEKNGQAGAKICGKE